MIVDAHQHYWQPARGDYGWLAEAPPALRRAFLPADLRAERAAAGVHHSLLVQAAPSEAETRYLFELARQDAAVLGVVGWVDLDAADADARIDALVAAGGGLLRGLRPMAQDLPDPGWLAHPALDRPLDRLAAHDLAFDALVAPAQWPALLARLERQPQLRVMLDHAGKPAISPAGFRRWAGWIDTLAAIPSVHCKLSGLLTQLEPGADADAIEPFVAHLFERFGAARLVWGSDWPGLTLRAGYAEWLHLAQALTTRHAPGRQADVFARNAVRFYALDIPLAATPGETP